MALLALGAGSVGLSADTLGKASVNNAAEAVSAPSSEMVEALRDRDVTRGSRSATRALLGSDLQKIEQIRVEQRVARAQARAKAKAEAKAEARAKAKAEAAAEARAKARAEARQAALAWRSPLAGYTITSPFGEYSSVRSGMHTGLDMSAPEGTPVTSVAAGTVVFAAYDGPWGNRVVVRHPDGTETWYCHMSAITVSVGQSVTNTSQVGNVGQTGNVTGPHLHLEVRPGGGAPIDPRAALAARGVNL